MEDTALKSIERLFNYGVLGIFCVLLIIALWLIIRHYSKREKEHAVEIKNFNEKQTDLTIKFLEMAREFKEQSKENTEATRKNSEMVGRLTDVIHSKL